MNVLMTSTSFPGTEDDWRGVFIRHVAESLVRRDDVTLSLWAPPGPADPRILRVTTESEADWLASLAASGGIAHLLRNQPVRAVGHALRLLRALGAAYRRSAADLYHVNWLQNALSLPPDGKPAVVTVLGSDMQLLRLPLMRAAIRRVLKRRSACICPNADWMCEELLDSFGTVTKIRTVSFGIDSRWYAIERNNDAAHPPTWIVVSRLTRAKMGPSSAGVNPYSRMANASFTCWGRCENK